MCLGWKSHVLRRFPKTSISQVAPCYLLPFLRSHFQTFRCLLLIGKKDNTFNPLPGQLVLGGSCHPHHFYCHIVSESVALHVASLSTHPTFFFGLFLWAFYERFCELSEFLMTPVEDPRDPCCCDVKEHVQGDQARAVASPQHRKSYVLFYS